VRRWSFDSAYRRGFQFGLVVGAAIGVAVFLYGLLSWGFGDITIGGYCATVSIFFCGLFFGVLTPVVAKAFWMVVNWAHPGRQGLRQELTLHPAADQSTNPHQVPSDNTQFHDPNSAPTNVSGMTWNRDAGISPEKETLE
jgi:hypothetical protein